MAKRDLELKPGRYSDGHPLDEVQYLECKLILKPDLFTSVASFREFGKLVARTARAIKKVEFAKDPKVGGRPAIREVVFLDTADFRLYNNAFILRRRIAYHDGFPVGDPEIVFKFRHPELQRAAELDVRPHLPEKYRIKFKAEALPLRDRIGGMRLLYSHNCEFALGQTRQEDTPMSTLAQVFPALAAVKPSDTEHVSLVNEVIVEEVLLDLGELDFGKGVVAKANVALWRTRGDHRPLVGEFAYQCKFLRQEDVHAKPRKRCEKFYIALQEAARDWIAPDTTKTGVIYRLKGNPPQSHE